MKQLKSTSRKQKLLWAVLSLLLAAGSFYLVLRHSGGLSLEALQEDLTQAAPGWLIAAACSMLVYVTLEGRILRIVCGGLGHPLSRRRGLAYAASDIYFSAVTPSATGGQPACAYFMIQDGIPETVSTVCLLLNLTMYTLTLAVLGVVCVVIGPGLFLCFGTLGRILIVIGLAAHLALAFFFFLLVRNERLLHRLCGWALRLLGKLRLVRQEAKLQAKLQTAMEDYRRCTQLLAGQKKLMIRVFVLNLLQRAAQISVTGFVFLAAGHGLGQAAVMWAIQCYVILGAACIPIPGAMGISDYLLLNGFSAFLAPQEAASMELISRSISFYCCTVLCAVITLVYSLIQIRRRSFP